MQQGPFAVAHRRLEIIDWSEHVPQPTVDRALGLTLVFNGCVCHYRAMRDKHGMSFALPSDVMLHVKGWTATSWRAAGSTTACASSASRARRSGPGWRAATCCWR